MALPFYHCTGIITKPASAKEKLKHHELIRVASKYPNIAKDYFYKTIRQELPRRGKFDTMGK